MRLFSGSNSDTLIYSPPSAHRKKLIETASPGYPERPAKNVTIKPLFTEQVTV